MNKIALLLFSLLFSANAREIKISSFESTVKPFLNKYCVECHGAKKKKSGIRFDDLTGFIDGSITAQLLQDTVDVLNTADMPPEDEKQPTAIELETVINTLSHDVANAARVLSGSDKSKMRRLNKREYINTLKDKMGVHLKEDKVLDELVGHDFDTFSTNLNLSRANLEAYMSNGREAVERFIALAEEKRTKVVIPFKLTKVKGGHIFHGKVKDLPEGDYHIQVKAWTSTGKPGYFRHKSYDKAYLITGDKKQPTLVKKKFSHFSEAVNKHVFGAVSPHKSSGKLKKGNYGFQNVEIHGVVSSQQSKKFFAGWDVYLKGETPSESQVAELLNKFSLLMCRDKKLDSSFLNYLVNLYKSELVEKKSFKSAIIEPMALILSSPEFLYFSPSEKLSATDLRSRLALLLWSSSADKVSAENVKDLAEIMLADSRSDRFLRTFHDQWFEISKLDEIAVNNTLYPEFNSSLKLAFKEQSYSLFKTLVLNNEPISNLIDADFIMANSVIAGFYGLRGEYTNSFKRYKTDSAYGGLLNSPVVMTITSTGVRTSPVERGAYILRKFLDDPPLPAPANVPELAAIQTDGLTSKQILSNHTRTPQCAACHRKMDGLGFAMEGFDAIGKIRKVEKRLVENGKVTQIKLDSRGTFAGKELNGYSSLKSFLLQNKDKLARSYIKALLSYSIGRRVGFADKEDIEALVELSAKSDYRMKDMILNVINSKTFRRR
ncbi:MAG: DUF1588 domain-containing protein [Lentisphaeraceae bacterium]|nr:DUF1588 domain-containing protein [Lentisphaeraceae bacterium]